jgi:hypothetical protein
MVGKVKRLLQIVAVGVLTAMPLLGRSASAASATLFLSPAASSVAKGGTLLVGIRENSGGEPVNGVQANLTYPANLLTYTGATSSSAFGIVAQTSGGGGSVQIGRGALPAVSGNQLVATLKFKANTDTGVATINFAGGSSVVSANSNQNIMTGSTGGNYTLTKPVATPPPPPADKIPPTIKDIKTTEITPTSASITWTTSEPSTTEVVYGLNKGYGLSATDGNMVTAHKISLTSALLTPGTLYHFMVKSVDPSGNATSSPDHTFTTKGATLLATVIDQHNKPVKGAKVSFGDNNGVTDKKGQVTLYNLPLGKQLGTVTFRHKQSVVNVEVKTIDPKGAPQTATFKINVPSNLGWILLVPLIALLLYAAWWVGREEGEGINPFRALKAKVLGWMPGKSAKKGGPSDPGNFPPAQQPPTVITPSG